MERHDSPERYLRAWIDLDLVVRSPLHVGSGDVALLTDRILESRTELRKSFEQKDGLPQYRPMTMRWMNHGTADGEIECHRATIPGSTIKGALRDLFGQALEKYADELFGAQSDPPDVGATERRIGRVRFGDSHTLQSPTSFVREPPLWDPERGTAVRARVAINPVTGAAARHQLTFYEFVPEGSRISFRFECFDISKDAVHAFCRALAGLDVIRLGGGAALGAGRLGWAETDGPAPLRVDALTQEAFARWLVEGSAEQAPQRETVWPPTGERADERAAVVPSSSVNLVVEAVDPLLVASGLDRAEKDKKTGLKTEERPDQLYALQTPEGRIRIPASSLRGALRARARKILLLWLREIRPETDADRAGDGLLSELFGDTSQASPLQLSDFLSEQPVEKSRLHHQYFNAIDRFTGGVAKGHLYEVRATPPGTRFRGRIAARPGMELLPWARLLLALVLRDLERGDIALGWGKAKGYGTVRLLRVGEHADNALFRGLPDTLKFEAPAINDFTGWLRDQLEPLIRIAEENPAIEKR
jgi:CRISPR/Cas system CSM-associated protein Csm3 (group 7 of RAMP superfamily)